MMAVIDVEGTGRNIETLRKQSNISVGRLQRIFGFHTPQAIYKWQRGDCLPACENLLVLSRLFHTPMEEILAYEYHGDLEISAEEDRVMPLAA